MEKKLFCVKVVLFVMAENESDARIAATQAHFDIFECSARKAESITPEWEDAIPYNADDDRTCLEILTSQRQKFRTETPSIKLPSYVEAAIKEFNIDRRSIQPGQQAWPDQ
jgi:hypothetical protein